MDALASLGQPLCGFNAWTPASWLSGYLADLGEFHAQLLAVSSRLHAVRVAFRLCG
jgi:hypothetical protein